MELPRVVFFGRTGSDALHFFDLDLTDWRGARILDCPGGPGSLVATARRNGVEALAVDPLYALSPALKTRSAAWRISISPWSAFARATPSEPTAIWRPIAAASS